MDKSKEVIKKDIIWIPLNYSYIKETPFERFIVLDESLFTKTFEETLDKWKPFLKGNKHLQYLYSDIEKIQIDEMLSSDYMKPIVPIKLTINYEICYGYGVSLSLEDFIKSSIIYLKNVPLKLKSWTCTFSDRLQKKLIKLKRKIKNEI